jgi:hypothetical protein
MVCYPRQRSADANRIPRQRMFLDRITGRLKKELSLRKLTVEV